MQILVGLLIDFSLLIVKWMRTEVRPCWSIAKKFWWVYKCSIPKGCGWPFCLSFFLVAETLGQTPERCNGKGEEFQRNYMVAFIIMCRQPLFCIDAYIV